MPFRVETTRLALRTKHPFVIARGGESVRTSVMVKLIAPDGLEGWGEAAPVTYYGETPESVEAAVCRYAEVLGDDPFDTDGAERRMLQVMRLNGAARVAISSALHDLAGKRAGLPVWKLLGLDTSRLPRSTFTIGIDTTEMIRRKVQEAAEYPILKIKLGSDRDVELLRTIREVTDRELRVDANCAWSARHAVRMLPVLEEFGVTVLEQPVAAGDLEGFAEIRRHARIPLIADESCVDADDIPALVGRVDGINIKLAKCGSLREAMRMAAVARAHHLMVMLGCMIESSLAITAAAHVAALCDIVDLDGAALLADDPFIGATIAGGQLTLPDGPGLGVRAR